MLVVVLSPEVGQWHGISEGQHPYVDNSYQLYIIISLDLAHTNVGRSVRLNLVICHIYPHQILSLFSLLVSVRLNRPFVHFFPQKRANETRFTDLHV